MQAAALVGHQVMVAGSGLQLGDTGAVGGLAARCADQVTVTIKDPNGMVDAHASTWAILMPARTTSAWDGTTDAGVTGGEWQLQHIGGCHAGTEKVTERRHCNLPPCSPTSIAARRA
jgi:flagellar hook assembly protein FlgD